MPTHHEPKSAPAPSSSSSSRAPESYETLPPIRDPDGLLARVTVRARDGRVSFSITREFEQNGKTMETKFFNKRHIPGIVRILNDLNDQLDEIEDRQRSMRRDRSDHGAR